MDPERLLIFAGSLEKGSEHPLGLAVVAEAQRRGLKLNTPSDFSALPGFGVKGIVAGKSVLLGNKGLMVENQIDISSINTQLGNQWRMAKLP